MLHPLLLFFYTFQCSVISLHLYPSSRHIYLILAGLSLQRLLSLFLYTRLRFVVGSFLILLYLQYPFLYFLSYSYILTNTYYSASLLVKSVDISHTVYYMEISSSIVSFLIHVDYSVIYLLFVVDLILAYFKSPPPYEERHFQEIMESIKRVVKDVQTRKKEYQIILREYTIKSVYDERKEPDINRGHFNINRSQNDLSRSQFDINRSKNDFSRSQIDYNKTKFDPNITHNDLSRSQNEGFVIPVVEHNISEKYNLVEGNIVEEKGKPAPKSSFYISLDCFTPLILNKDMYSLLLLILRLIPMWRRDYIYFLFIFLYMIEYRLGSLIVSAFCNFSNIRNINSRMISTVIIYYLIKEELN